MIIVNGNNLPQQVVKVLDREENLLVEVQKMNERYETAHNLKNMQEIQAIEEEGAELQSRLNMHIAEKVIVMSMYMSKNRHFAKN
jgi:hypothetical protein